jgi:predicted metal-dependent enzyme (double-stranded beta helix superfamily)
MFDLDQFIADCRLALAADKSHKLVREVVARSVAEPAAIIKVLGEPSRGELKALYRSPEMTILNIAWAPYMTLMPHNHNMWAVIGIYTGRETTSSGGVCPTSAAGWRPPVPRRLAAETPSRSGATSFIR